MNKHKVSIDRDASLIHAVLDERCLTIAPGRIVSVDKQGDHGCRITAEDGGVSVFHRSAVHLSGDGKTVLGETVWLVAELDGVRLYDTGDGRMLLTKQDVNP